MTGPNPQSEALERARALGATVLSEGRLTRTSVVHLRCSADHLWESTVPLLLEGASCPKCRRFQHSILTMRALAAKNCGQCLSPAYRGMLEKLEWRCEKGHEWLATPNTIMGGSWCKVCNLGMWSIEDMRAFAASHGGRCLSDAYRGKDEKLEWECAEGHRWASRAAYAQRGAWCPHCAGVAPLTIELFRELARARGGECLSQRYRNTQSVLRFRCEKRHEWATAASNVRAGYWCPHCSGTAKGNIERMRAVAEARGGTCVSKRYVNSTTKLTWRCAKNHEWHAVPTHVVQGSWCPECAPSRQHTLSDMKRLAAERGGRCLSSVYVKSRARLTWACAKGHRFDATPMGVLGGRWCLVCKREEAHRKAT